MFDKILIANRGEIACRVIKTARKMGIKTVAVYSDADRNALHVQMADEAVHIGPPPAAQSYIVIDKIMAAIKATGRAGGASGLWLPVGEPQLRRGAGGGRGGLHRPAQPGDRGDGGQDHLEEDRAGGGGFHGPGYMGLIADADEAVKISAQIGYPVMIKASAGGGGKGMRIAWNDAEAAEGFQSSKNEAAASFGDDRIFIEKFVTQPRHIEIQVLADKHGNCVYLHERECSIQRRNQKVIEEAPSPFLDEATRKAMGEQACALAKAVGYTSAGTVEFIVDGNRNFYFLEMNTRLQVEHPVTELITGVDLVEQMIRVADGQPLPFKQSDLKIHGWAMESRLYAEDPYRNFLPSIGRLTRYRPPVEGKTSRGGIVRNDTGVYEGGEISMFYDPMIAKLCTWGPTRADAIEEMRLALDTFEVEGIGHNLPFCSAVMDHPRFASGNITTAFIAEEYEGGFTGATLDASLLRRVAAAAAAMNRVAEIRRTRISGTMDNHTRRVGDDWVVTLQGESWKVAIKADPAGSTVVFDDGTDLRVESDWTPGQPLARLSVGGEPLVIKVAKIPMGFRMRLRGADLKVRVQTPRQKVLAGLMLEKAPPDTSKYLLCPMPGLVVKIAVSEGDEVQEGQALATVEAMKMENILKAERKGVVKKIKAAAGASLKVDDVIMEFE
jgi:propionyl-CoA carboxylase alpha chain